MLSLVMHVYPGISWDILGYPWPTMLRQDCCLILPPYPFSLEDPSAMSLEDEWNVRPHCSSSAFCALATEGPPKMPPGRVAPMTWKPILCFFSTFEELKLPATGRLSGPMDHAITKLYEPSPTPILYVAP